MKKFLKILKYLGVILLGLFTTWAAVNLWPRKMEPLLWTEADLSSPPQTGKDAYPYLKNLAPHNNSMQSPRELNPIYSETLTATEADSALFWQEAHRVQSEWHKFFADNTEFLADWRKLLQFDQIIDRDPTSLEQEGIGWLAFYDLQQVGLLKIFDQFLDGDKQEAYSNLLRQLHLDLSLLQSARRLLVNRIAMTAVEGDLVLLRYFLAESPPSPEQKNRILEELKSADFDSIDMKNGMVSEYLAQSSAAHLLEQDRDANPLLRWVFNPAIFRRDLNQLYRRYDVWRINPNTLSDRSIEELNQELADIDQGALWWLFNPGGKTLLGLTMINVPAVLQDSFDDKAKLQRARNLLLARLQNPTPESKASP